VVLQPGVHEKNQRALGKLVAPGAFPVGPGSALLARRPRGQDGARQRPGPRAVPLQKARDGRGAHRERAFGQGSEIGERRQVGRGRLARRQNGRQGGGLVAGFAAHAEESLGQRRSGRSPRAEKNGHAQLMRVAAAQEIDQRRDLGGVARAQGSEIRRADAAGRGERRHPGPVVGIRGRKRRRRRQEGLRLDKQDDGSGEHPMSLAPRARTGPRSGRAGRVQR